MSPPTRPSSPSLSASGSIGFNFDSSVASVASATATNRTSKANFWDFEAFSRLFLHEKKLIEREKEEWERKVEERKTILKKSSDFYLEKLSNLKCRSEKCLKSLEIIVEKSELVEIENEIAVKSDSVEKLKKLMNYFQSLQTILKEKESTENFEGNLTNWKESLDNLTMLINTHTDTQQLSNINALKNEIICSRLNLFHSTLEAQIKKYIDGLGWPKIISNGETVEIISKLQELLTYGEAIYILSSSLSLSSSAEADSSSSLSSTMPQSTPSSAFDHPLKYFIDPIKLRFNYHFNSDRPTNQIDRPEWYFDHLISLCRDTLSFMREFIFPCWRLRDLDDFLRDGIIKLAEEATFHRLYMIKIKQELVIHHLIEFGKFLQTLQNEFGCLCEDEGIIEHLFIRNSDDFVQKEHERIKSEYEELYANISEVDCNENVDSWSPNIKNHPQAGEPSPIVIKFLSFFHSKTVLPYSFIRKDLKIRSELLVKVQTWLLEAFHDKCQFECSPLHNDKESILKDIGMINSMIVICKVLRDDFGESLDYLELSSSEELKGLIGYDSSLLPGTCFNRAIEAFTSISDRLSSHVFNYVMDRFLKPALAHSNSMIYARDNDALSENMRLAMSNVLEAINYIRPFLCDRVFVNLFHKLLPEKISAFMFQGVLLKNFFTETGSDRFYQDLQYIQETLSSSDESFAKVFEAAQILKIKEKDPTAPFDGHRLAKAVKENRIEDLKRFLELMRLNHLRVDELEQIFASRRH